MMKGWKGISIGIVILLLVVAGMWGYGYIRRVDSRTPAQWLAYADHANQSVAYHARGYSVTNKVHATFSLDQSTDGRYNMTTRDTKGHVCSLGYDGSHVWYTAGTTQEKMTVAASKETPVPDHAKIVGLGIIAGRKVVRLAVTNRQIEKSLAIDRSTGVVLSMSTRVQGKPVSAMVIEQIAYRPVAISSCSMACCARAQSINRTALEKQLGGKVAEPQWLPTGYVLTDMLLEPCGECKMPMGVLRYSDGIGAVTLFEMSQHDMMCSMGAQCHPAATNHTLVDSKTIGTLSVTAVGTMDARTLQQIMKSLR